MVDYTPIQVDGLQRLSINSNDVIPSDNCVNGEWMRAQGSAY